MSSPFNRTLFLCGDVMTGRGVDQILRCPSRPDLFEPAVHSALDYVSLAEHATGPIPRAVDEAYVWGVALDELERRDTAARIVNLETSVTTSEQALPKGINYRMHPANVGVLTAARIDCASLANNHVLDWGVNGLYDTLDTLTAAHVLVAGVGRTQSDAEAPAVIELDAGHRVLVFAFGVFDSGVPPEWRATAERPGVNWIGDFSSSTVSRVADLVSRFRQRGDVVIGSMHWGSNWGYEIPAEHRAFAHRLIDAGCVDLVHGHSSHHVKAIEVYRDRLILYGCGDFLNDYEGIQGYEDFRDDLTLMYFPTLDVRSGALVDLEVVPLLIRHFRLQHPAADDTRWLRETVDREGERFGTRLERRNGALHLAWR